MNLQHFLYHWVKMEDSNNLFVEIHQEHAMGNVEVVIPTAPPANSMIASMNKQSADLLLNYLKQVSLMPENLIKRFLIVSVDGSMIYEERLSAHGTP